MGQVRTTQLSRLAGLGFAAVAAIAVTAGATPANAAEGAILNAGAPGAVKGSYIVVLKDTGSIRFLDINTVARRLTSRHLAKVGFVYDSVVSGFSATMSERQARLLAANPDVAYVEQDRVVHATATQTNPPSWGLDRIDQRNLPLNRAYSYTSTAGNVNAYIIDTGIQRAHTTFGGRAVTGFDAVTAGGTAEDCNGHGTHVAGTVGGSQYGVAKAVRLYAVRVLNCQGSGTTAGVIAGVNWVTTNARKPAVANMSLGGGASTTLDQAVSRSITSGVSYAIAAGNGDIFGRPVNACTQSPARVAAAITVSATQSNDAKPTWANIGTCVDIFAPGVGITSSWIGSNTATNTISGTSMATPHVTGAAARYLATHPTATPAQVASAIIAASTPGKVIGPGAGSPNRLLYVPPGW